MMTLYHSPNSRSSAIVTLIEELGADVEVKEVTVRRLDGTGEPDPSNPHPEKKVPYLVDGAEAIRERGAIMLYLTDKFPEAGLGPIEGQPKRGEYLSWLFYYQGVMEPVIILKFAGLTHPALEASLRDYDTMVARLVETLEKQPYLLGENYSAVDLLCSGPFLWLPDLMPDNEAIRDWVKRCSERPATVRTFERERNAA
ncbi:glutathione S-transferase family protein [Stappia sp. BW2]|uniref:glutathione S-transferase family protein n=1 Tax=Stappia sp. BW2 TaxID=2592622 RepID=UPI0011DE9F29|nr:glutathione S-transferase family protein [Stappia sp. BW2]TYC67231.1 glutathione S-transferase family protein [Stappia sp. BW2]